MTDANIPYVLGAWALTAFVLCGVAFVSLRAWRAAQK